MSFVEPTYGSSFCRERGLARFLRKESITVWRGWPRPQAWTKSKHEPQWRSFRPGNGPVA